MDDEINLRLTVNLPALDDFLKSIGSYTQDMIFGVEQGQALNHYTDLAGLQGIVEDHELWLTHSRRRGDHTRLP